MITPTKKPGLSGTKHVVNNSQPPCNKSGRWQRMPVLRARVNANIPKDVCDRMLNYLTSSHTVNDGDVIEIGANGVYEGTNIMGVPSENAFKASKSGFYKIVANVNCQGPTGAVAHTVHITVNGTTVGDSRVNFIQSGRDVVMHCETYTTLNANDLVRFVIEISGDTSTSVRQQSSNFLIELL